MLILKQLKKQLKTHSLLFNVDVPATGVTTLFGPSGVGKTTLLNMIGGLTVPDSGFISFNHRTFVDFSDSTHFCLSPQKRKIGYVFQDSLLFLHLSVKQNLCYGMPRKNTIEFEKIVQLLGVEHLLTRYPKHLSGGEKQRIAIGRALLSNPELLLMDEPLSSLDNEIKAELLNYLITLTQHINLPILYVTHNIDEMKILSNHAILLNRDGHNAVLNRTQIEEHFI